MSDATRFAFVQFEFAFALGPADGRYLVRGTNDESPRRVIVLRTLGARERRLLRGRRPVRQTGAAEPSPVPTVRATLIETEPLADEATAEQQLEELRRDAERRDATVAAAPRELSAFLRAHRAAAADPYVRDVVATSATVVRVGYGDGESVAEGRFTSAYELPDRPERHRRVDTLAPQERLAAILAGRDRPLVGEELVLRARSDLDAARPREAALQARIALEALLAELPRGDLTEALERHRDAVAQAANEALAGELGDGRERELSVAVAQMGEVLAAHGRRSR